MLECRTTGSILVLVTARPTPGLWSWARRLVFAAREHGHVLLGYISVRLARHIVDPLQAAGAFKSRARQILPKMTSERVLAMSKYSIDGGDPPHHP